MKPLLVLLAVVTLTACAPKTYHQTVVVDNVVQITLQAVTVAEQATFASGAYDLPTHVAHAQKIADLTAAAQQLHVALMAWNPENPMPPDLVQAGNTLRALLVAVQDFLPANNKYIVALSQAIGLLTKGQ